MEGFKGKVFYQEYFVVMVDFYFFSMKLFFIQSIVCCYQWNLLYCFKDIDQIWGVDDIFLDEYMLIMYDRN